MTNEPTSTTEKRIHIFTGAPGSGKLVHIYNSPYLRTLPIFCCYHLNKRYWEGDPRPEIILCSYAAAWQAKEYWLEQALAVGRTPRLYCMKTDARSAQERLMRRPRNKSLLKELNNWYDWYTPHPMEEPVYLPEYDPDYEKGAYT